VRGAFLDSLVAKALEHQLGGTPDVDIGYHCALLRCRLASVTVLHVGSSASKIDSVTANAGMERSGSWILPSRARPHNIERLIKAWKETRAATPCVLVIDADDPFFAGHMALGSRLPEGWTWKSARVAHLWISWDILCQERLSI
jgi:hypothetical protein